MHIIRIYSLLFLGTGVIFAKPPKDNFTYLDNGTVRIGVDQTRGFAIGLFVSGSNSNPTSGKRHGCGLPLFLAIGTLDEIRARFAKIAESKELGAKSEEKKQIAIIALS